MFFIKAETLGFGFFVTGKPCAGGMVEENLRLFSISLFAFPFLLFPALSAFPALLSLFYFSFFFPFPFLFPFFLSFFFPSFPSFPLCSLRIKFLCYCKKYGPAAVLMNTQYGTRKYHRPEILQKGVLGQTSSGNRSYT